MIFNSLWFAYFVSVILYIIIIILYIIILGLIEYELNSLLGASHLVDYISVHIRFDLERYLLNIIIDPLISLRVFSGPLAKRCRQTTSEDLQ